jgi:6,7-dimethyl-8-ribityllumazine synthase
MALQKTSATSQEKALRKIEPIRIAIVSSSFRAEVADNLEKKCLQTLSKKGFKKEQTTIRRVPGALEIPLMVQKLAKRQNIPF